ncbi:RagB/SusD family nutrient uptake outer membrane protein [Flavivirga jejuensis]|uniref:RagB/SusD family nutrient uptake outer membrane protein n=1 Tax=Flavivirga jejuensis TaxID=870487 RepID=A0ABT8WKP7_9FLAO|nr:RagB/SusD family nutrient uptake outer membrane protein [Flavivirga jejuensis]MDO5973726.1 RagB/SusD family nutrient uptake outer membrane protein [Flavivirga jejuensis]
MNSIKRILVAFIVFGMVACNEAVLDQYPNHVISENLVYGSTENLEKVLIGAYNELSRSDYLGRVLYKRAAVKSADFRYVQTNYNPRTYELIEYKNEESTTNSGSAASLWNQAYKTISNLNIVLDYIDESDGNDAEKIKIKAEALALRGMIYFDLSRTFTYPWIWIKEGSNAQGLPLNLSSTENTVERSTLGQTYEQIILDMNMALELLNDNTWEEGSTKFITKTGVHALLSRIYLYKEDWDNALDYATEVLSVKGASNLMTVDNYVFNDYTSESLFEISITEENSLGSNGLGAQFNHDEGGQGDVISTSVFVNLLNEYTDDPRASLLKTDKEGTNMAFVKYINRADGGGLSIHNIPVIRLSEIYLIAAEACANGAGGGDPEALVFLNTLIEKRTSDFATHQATEIGDALKERIFKERRKELALEGHGIHDYIRLGKDVIRLAEDHVNTGVNIENLVISASSNKVIYPIPSSEVNASGIKQTTGYN